jgi:hypothetical protein
MADIELDTAFLWKVLHVISAADLEEMREENFNQSMEYLGEDPRRAKDIAREYYWKEVMDMTAIDILSEHLEDMDADEFEALAAKAIQHDLNPNGAQSQ